MREFLRFVLFSSLCSFGGAVSGADGGRALRVQLSTDGARPYEENLPGDVLATFSDNVFGNWIHLVAPGEYASDLIDFDFQEGGRALSVRLKDGVRFHNGRAITADDFVFSLLRGLSTNNHAFYRSFLSCLDGVGKLAPGEVPRGVTVRSAREIELRFTRSCPEIVHTLGLPYVAPRPAEELAADLVHFKGLPIGAGPYRVVREDIERGEFEIARVGGGGGAERLVLATKAGMPSDILLSRNSALAPEGYATVAASAPSTTTTLFASNRHPVISRNGVASLIYRALDRQAIVANVGERPAFSLSLFGTHEVSATERAQARRDLTALKLDHPTLKFAIFGSPDDARKKQLIASLTAQFDEIGFGAQFEFVNKKFLTAEDAVEFAFQVANLVIDPLAAGVMLSSWRGDSANPYHQVRTAELEALFRGWESAAGREAKDQAAERLDDYLTTNGFGVPLLRNHALLIFNPESVKSLGEQNLPLAIDFRQVSPCASSLSR